MTMDPMFPAIKTPEQARGVEQALTEYESAKSHAFNILVRFFDDYGFELKKLAERNTDDEMDESIRDCERAIEIARDAQETFMRSIIGR